MKWLFGFVVAVTLITGTVHANEYSSSSFMVRDAVIGGSVVSESNNQELAQNQTQEQLSVQATESPSTPIPSWISVLSAALILIVSTIGLLVYRRKRMKAQ